MFKWSIIRSFLLCPRLFYICTSPSHCYKHRYHFLLLSASGEAQSSSRELPVTMTWRCGRNGHVLPGEWPGQRKTSDHPWKKRALHSVKAAKLGCISVNWLYLELLSPPTPCKNNSQQIRKWSLTASWGRQRAHWKLEEFLSFASCSWESRHLSAGRGQVARRVPWLWSQLPFSKPKCTYTPGCLGHLEPLELCNPVCPAGRTSVFFQRKHNWTASNCCLFLLPYKCLSQWIIYEGEDLLQNSLTQGSQVNMVIDFYWVTGTFLQR